MTIPTERTRAIQNTEAFLQALTDPKRTPRVPAAVRAQARQLLRHFPSAWDLSEAAAVLPHVFGAPRQRSSVAATAPARSTRVPVED